MHLSYVFDNTKVIVLTKNCEPRSMTCGQLAKFTTYEKSFLIQRILRKCELFVFFILQYFSCPMTKHFFIKDGTNISVKKSLIIKRIFLKGKGIVFKVDSLIYFK